jgi:UDP-4-amino-4,6-dideoxy-N-acetyl-beta-L-altrosamine N-acetyltransferase
MNAEISIRPMRNDDVVQVLAWRNHPNVRRYMRTQHEISKEEHQRWFDRISHDQSYQLLIVEGNEIPLGFVNFSGLSAQGVADWGFYLTSGAPQGSGKKLGIAALDFAFKELKLHKVCGQALAFNEASIRLHKKLGFFQEGVLREQCLIAHQYHHLLCFGILSEEWLKDK